MQSPLRPIGVLVLDPHGDDVAAVRAVLDDTFAVHHATEVGEVIAAAQRGDVDILVVVDVEREAVPASAHGLPVLALTRGEDEDARLASLAHGALEHVPRSALGSGLLSRAIRYVLERKRLERELERLAHVDALTGLHNRRHLTKRIDAAISSALRHGHPLSLCIVDVDRFKEVNDVHGHLAGDEVLRAVGAVLATGVRTEDDVARWGGDEFVLVLEHADADEALAAVERIRRRLARLVVRSPAGVELGVSATFGVAQLDRSQPDARALFAAADAALYEGKRKGRGVVTAG